MEFDKAYFLLLRLRERSHMTLKGLAQILGVHSSTVGRVMNPECSGHVVANNARTARDHRACVWIRQRNGKRHGHLIHSRLLTWTG
jgi:hypothetical protein